MGRGPAAGASGQGQTPNGPPRLPAFRLRRDGLKQQGENQKPGNGGSEDHGRRAPIPLYLLTTLPSMNRICF
jgi:hypothetical protein